jgi:PAS domain-containing protein
LRSIVDRLPSTLLVAKVAVFMADAPDAQTSMRGFHLAASHGLPFSNEQYTPRLDLGFLDFDQSGGQSHIFLENTQQNIHLSQEQQRTAALLDLNYYLPCRVQDAMPSVTHAATSNGLAKTRTIAVIGLGRTIGGDFLSSEDVELLESLASYIGIALQSASLYARLEEQVSEFERLKEFNENIVESINVGILAVDLEDRIESWNAQMEAMYALSRKEAIGQPLTSVFPREFIEARPLPQRERRASSL